MFVNLVRIEIIRLINNRTLKYLMAFGVLAIFCWVMTIDYAVQVTSSKLLRDVPASSIDLIGYIMAFSLVVLVISVVTVIFTTCDYNQYKLAVNIEGAVRSRIKLYLSEIVGILLFVAGLNLFVLPGALVIIASDPAELGGLIEAGNYDLLGVYITITVSSVYSSIIVYLISRLFPNKILAAAFSLLFQILGGLFFIAVMGFARGYNDSVADQIPDSLINTSIGIVFALPVILLTIAIVAKNRKADRI